MDDMTAAAEAYKRTASIIQGVLIALSAVIAVVGYFVKGRIDRKEKIRVTQLDTKQRLLNQLVGPAQAMSYGGLMARINFVACEAWPGEFCRAEADETQTELWFFGAGENGAKFREKVHNHTSPNATQLWTFVGREKEEEMRKNPSGKLAVAYRRMMRQILRCYYVPLSNLLNEHMNVLPLPNKEDFKRRYPGASASIALRKLFFLQVVVWTNEMQSIITEEWDRSDYDRLFPTTAPFPFKLCQYLAQMLTTLKTEIEELTHKAVPANSNDDDTKVENMNKKKEVNRAEKGGSSESKYVVVEPKMEKE